MSDQRFSKLKDFLLKDDVNLDEDLSAEELMKHFKTIDSFQVLRMFTEDHTECYDVKFVIEGQEQLYTFNWIGDYSRLFYQSEVIRDVLETQLKPFLAEEILNQ